jgi:hypothetical protein
MILLSELGIAALGFVTFGLTIGHKQLVRQNLVVGRYSVPVIIRDRVFG